MLNVLEFFSILELETLKLNTYGNTNNKNIKIYILTQCLVDYRLVGVLYELPTFACIGKGRLSLCFKRNGNYLFGAPLQMLVRGSFTKL